MILSPTWNAGQKRQRSERCIKPHHHHHHHHQHCLPRPPSSTVDVSLDPPFSTPSAPAPTGLKREERIGNRPLAREHHPTRPQRHHAGQPQPGFPSSPTPTAAADEPLLPPPLPRRHRDNMSSSTSTPAEKPSRRGGTAGPHVLRAGGPASNSKRPSQAVSNMPAPPPKAAMLSTAANSNGPDEVPEPASTSGTGGGGGGGGATLKDRQERDKESHRSEAWPKVATSSSSDAANALLLRQRDEKIASLEHELATTRREFAHELDRLAEATTYWQTKQSATHQKFLTTDTELRVLRNDVEAREREREELRNEWEREREELRGGWEMLRRTLAERDGEARALRAQVRGLKEFVSTATRTDGQQAATDESLAEAVARLANGLQNWVITNFRRAKLRPAEELDEAVRAEAGELLPMFEELAAGGSKVHLLQSMVSRLLVDEVLGAYYVGLSKEQTRQFQEMEQMLASFASEEAVNQWRASTLALVHRDAATHLQAGTAALVENLTSRTIRLLDSILQPGSTAAPPTPDTRETSLRHLFTSSLDLSRLLAVQRAAFGIQMPPILPHQRVLFDPTTMEDVGGEDEDALVEREISCVVFPGLIKQGDESGGHLKVYRNVIAKARVWCAPES